MSRAEKFIEEHTNTTYNYNSYAQDPIPWLTPDQARRAVEIAREEMIERALIAFQVVCNRPAKLFPNCEAHCNACEQFKQAMKDE